MFIREDAKERAKELAVQGLSKTAIRKKLEKEGMAGLLDDHSLESVVREGHTIGHFMPAKPNKLRLYRRPHKTKPMMVDRTKRS